MNIRLLRHFRGLKILRRFPYTKMQFELSYFHTKIIQFISCGYNIIEIILCNWMFTVRFVGERLSHFLITHSANFGSSTGLYPNQRFVSAHDGAELVIIHCAKKENLKKKLKKTKCMFEVVKTLFISNYNCLIFQLCHFSITRCSWFFWVPLNFWLVFAE